jgi:putative flippase GtrA
VEVTIMHNFAWHERFTWRERSSRAATQILRRFAELNLSTGMISIVVNLALMKLLVGAARLDVLLANLISVLACSLLNFLVGDRVIFRAAV